MKFSECLRQAREKAGLTQKELAEKLNVPPQMINRYENSNTEPRIGFVVNIANILNISLDELMKTGKSAPNPEPEIGEEGNYFVITYKINKKQFKN